MAFDGFIACVRTKEEDLANALQTLGEDGVRGFYSWYSTLPDVAKYAIGVAVEARNKDLVKAALSTAGLELGLAASVGIALAVGNDLFNGAVQCAQGNLSDDS